MEDAEKIQLREVHEAIVGNSKTGNRGLLERVSSLEKIVFKLIIASAAGAGGVGVIKGFEFLMQ